MDQHQIRMQDDDLEDLGSYLRIEEPAAAPASAVELRYERTGASNVTSAPAEAPAGQAGWSVSNAGAGNARKRRAVGDNSGTAVSSVPVRPRRAAQEAAIHAIRKAVVDADGPAASADDAYRRRDSGAGASGRGDDSSGDDDEPGGRGGTRKGRKNERERQRRMEVNEGFEKLGTLLAVERRFKAEKSVVLQSAIDEIVRLRQLVGQLQGMAGLPVDPTGGQTVISAALGAAMANALGQGSYAGSSAAAHSGAAAAGPDSSASGSHIARPDMRGAAGPGVGIGANGSAAPADGRYESRPLNVVQGGGWPFVGGVGQGPDCAHGPTAAVPAVAAAAAAPVPSSGPPSNRSRGKSNAWTREQKQAQAVADHAMDGVSSGGHAVAAMSWGSSAATVGPSYAVSQPMHGMQAAGVPITTTSSSNGAAWGSAAGYQGGPYGGAGYGPPAPATTSAHAAAATVGHTGAAAARARRAPVELGYVAPVPVDGTAAFGAVGAGHVTGVSGPAGFVHSSAVLGPGKAMLVPGAGPGMAGVASVGMLPTSGSMDNLRVSRGAMPSISVPVAAGHPGAYGAAAGTGVGISMHGAGAGVPVTGLPLVGLSDSEGGEALSPSLRDYRSYGAALQGGLTVGRVNAGGAAAVGVGAAGISVGPVRPAATPSMPPSLARDSSGRSDGSMGLSAAAELSRQAAGNTSSALPGVLHGTGFSDAEDSGALSAGLAAGRFNGIISGSMNILDGYIGSDSEAMDHGAATGSARAAGLGSNSIAPSSGMLARRGSTGGSALPVGLVAPRQAGGTEAGSAVLGGTLHDLQNLHLDVDIHLDEATVAALQDVHLPDVAMFGQAYANGQQYGPTGYAQPLGLPLGMAGGVAMAGAPANAAAGPHVGMALGLGGAPLMAAATSPQGRKGPIAAK